MEEIPLHVVMRVRSVQILTMFQSPACAGQLDFCMGDAAKGETTWQEDGSLGGLRGSAEISLGPVGQIWEKLLNARSGGAPSLV